ncbi:LPPG:FO 2-phospho-L-lactate transferase [Brevibacterium sanguinis]|uniref:LPPG:FO 2-phospho-L-lactate transferase n=2 Tax=Brevibacterium TaxID=1696 RepID=A0A366IK27_9MICO|nr:MULTISPECIES: 2-phospho-L-lactate transferase CofD family protein [Brevibacterium]RBP66136.1 LPPG:FO 2-phospho-L-lactate transferase [Brevibacterium sanguinis]RBP72787.1 LPPG:FO 2-phospho-L-lactate transferase [Brevibacterium celere]
MKVVLLGATGASLPILHELTAGTDPHDTATSLTVVASTLTDATVHGLRFCPDIDALTMPPADPVPGGAVDELRAYRVDAEWFPMTERTLAAAVLRTRLLNLGYTLAQAAEAMAKRFDPAFALLPLSNQAVEAFAIVDGTAWPIHRWFAESRPAAEGFVLSGLDSAQAAPGVLAAIRAADLVLVGTDAVPELGHEAILTLPGMTDALVGTRAHVVALAPPGGDRPPGGRLGGGLREHLPSLTLVAGVAEALALGEIDRTTSTIWDPR